MSCQSENEDEPCPQDSGHLTGLESVTRKTLEAWVACLGDSSPSGRKHPILRFQIALDPLAATEGPQKLSEHKQSSQLEAFRIAPGNLNQHHLLVMAFAH